jgi:glycosyltransferase involved in cell wall biosynthesis
VGDDRPLSILHVLLTGGWGGSERHCLDLIRMQQAAGHRAGLVLRPRSREPVTTYDYLPEQGGPELFRSVRPIDPVCVTRAAWAQGADVVHAHLGWSARAAGAAPLLCPAVGTLHMRYRPQEHARLEGVIRVADWQAEAMTGYRGRSITVHNWAPPLAPADPEAVEALRREAGADAATTLVGYVGRLHSVKGVDLLIEAFRGLPEVPARLAIVGDGPARADLEARAAGDPRIVFLGHRANPAAAYRALDLLVMPSRFDPFPLVALEAMAAGAAMLVARVGGLAEMFAGAPERLFPPEDAAALRTLLAATLARGGRPPRVAYDLLRFEPQAASARVERFYRELIAAARAGQAG